MKSRELDSSAEHGDALTYQVIGLAMEVHRELGPGLEEEFYHRRIAARLASERVPYLFKPRTELVYQGQVADVFEPDLVFPARLVVELKAQRGGLTAESLTQLLAYLKFWRIPVGLLFDFAKERLIFQRVIYTEPELVPFPELEVPAFVSDKVLPIEIFKQIEAIYQEHGLGYRDTTYGGLLLAGFRAAGLSCETEPLAPVAELGQTRLRCLVISKTCILTMSVLGEGLTAADRAITQTYLRLLRLPWGLGVHFGKRAIALRFVSSPAQTPIAKQLGTPRGFRATADKGKAQRVPETLGVTTEEYSI